MATTINLDDIFQKAEEKYGDLEIPGSDEEGTFSVKLQPLLRLPQTARDAIEDLLVARTDDEDEDGKKKRSNPVHTLQSFIRLVADDEFNAERLIERIGDRADVLKEIQELWFEKTQPGEAKPSQD